MDAHETFAQCLQRLLHQEGISASRAARMVGFRSRNSIFRILSGETSADVDSRFLAALHRAKDGQWPPEYWHELETALDIKLMGMEQHVNNHAFCQGMYGGDPARKYIVETFHDGRTEEHALADLLREICREGKLDVVISGCCERGLIGLLAGCFSEAALDGRLTVRHYIDSTGQVVVPNILSVMPLLSKVWYNARLVDEQRCPKEMAAIYRINVLCISVQKPDGVRVIHQMVQCGSDRFLETWGESVQEQMVHVLDRHRFELEVLKPIGVPVGGPEAFVEYTRRYAALEQGGMILSIKPDVHFNLVPTQLLYPAIYDGFAQSGIAGGEELETLLRQLAQIHDGRVANMYGKRRPTHIVYSVEAMERFMRTGVLSDQFFVQRAYTPEERRAIIRLLLQQMQENPFFSIHFLRGELPEIRSEMTLYEGKGVLMMDAYTSYDLYDDHSEALITLPYFQQSFQKFFLDVLLPRLVMNRQESMAQLERLMQL